MYTSAVTHYTLAKAGYGGEAHFIYAHPSVTKTSLVLINKKMFTPDIAGKIIEVRIKMMPSGKRIIIGRDVPKTPYLSIQQFIEAVGLGLMQRASQRQWEAEGKTGTYATKFDGKDDFAYQVARTRHMIPRFGPTKEEIKEDAKKLEKKVEPIVEPVFTKEAEPVEAEQVDGIQKYGALYISQHVISALTAAKQISEDHVASNVLLVGTSGNGKTSLAKELADQNKLTFVKVNCSVVRDPEEWFGVREAKDGTTVFEETEFTKAVKKGHCVILLDEINRLEPYIHNSLMPLLDETRETTIHGHKISCGKGTMFVSTMNVGSGYVGTFLLDAALKNRMDITIVMEKLTVEQEVNLLVERIGIEKEVAKTIVVNLEKIRRVVAENEIGVDVSHRSSLKIAKLVKASISLRQAITLAVFNNAETAEQAKMLADSLIA